MMTVMTTSQWLSLMVGGGGEGWGGWWGGVGWVDGGGGEGWGGGGERGGRWDASVLHVTDYCILQISSRPLLSKMTR